MSNLLLWLSLGLAIVEWLAVFKRWRKVEWVAKPGVMVALLAWVAVNGGLYGPMLWFVFGLLFSLAGDVLLLFDHFFAGLIAFLLAHGMYIFGFNTHFPPLGPTALVFVLLVVLTALWVGSRVLAQLGGKGLRRLRLPVIAYTSCISLMVVSALWTLARPQEWDAASALLVSLGALLFYVSDGTLAWNKFVAPMRYGRLVVMMTYHLGQMAIALGALIHFT